MNKDKLTAEEIILDVMRHHGFRRNYEVAQYFGVTPQTLSGWVKADSIPPKHFMKYEKEILSSLTDETEKNAIYVNIPQNFDQSGAHPKRVLPPVFIAQLLKGNIFSF